MYIKKILLIFAVVVMLSVAAVAMLSNKSDDSSKKETENKAASVATEIATPDASFVASKIAKDGLVVKTPSGFNVAVDLVPYFGKVKNDSVAELIWRDESGALAEIATILRTSQITVPEDILTAAEMKMYIFKKETDLGFSEALVIKNKKSADENRLAMRKWEETMIYDLRNFILIGEKYDLMKVSDVRTFSDSYYRNGRFANFSKGAYVTLDYVVADDYIVIGNSISILNEIVSKMYESKLLSE